MPKQQGSRSWIDASNLILGVLLICLPWIAGPINQAIEWNAWIVGGLVVFNAGCALAGFAAWEEWTNVLLGLWAVICPWVFGFEANVAATLTYVALGSAVAVLAAIQLWLVNRQLPGVTV